MVLKLHRTWFLAGRLLVAGVFGYMGFYKILNWDATSMWMASKGLPLIPLLLVGAIAVELGGGLLLAAGYQVRWVAALIALFLLPTNLIFHNFWALSPMEAAKEFLSFLQNVAIMGGLLALAAAEPAKEKAR